MTAFSLFKSTILNLSDVVLLYLMGNHKTHFSARIAYVAYIEFATSIPMPYMNYFSFICCQINGYDYTFQRIWSGGDISGKLVPRKSQMCPR